MLEQGLIQEIVSSIDKLKQVNHSVTVCLESIVEPLNERLKLFGTSVSWVGGSYAIYPAGFKGMCCIELDLDDAKLAELIDMSDDELLNYCKNWGKS